MNLPRTLILATLLVAVANSFSKDKTIKCTFDKNFATDIKEYDTSQLKGIYEIKKLALNNLKLTADTWKLDGSIRATNSNNWTKMPGKVTTSLILFGDRGDLLTIKLNEMGLDGTYDSILQYR